MSPLRAFLLLAALAAPAAADDAPAADLFDADGDGDIDADDGAILEAAEQIEIVDKSEAQQLRESARAVTVVELKQARERTADLGEVLSRAQGIQVRRSGGLGSSTRFSLNGLYDDQIRFFIDGMPLHLAGWGTDVANVPVALVQRVEVHRGVVPIALGADALGGAVDLVTDPSWVSRAAASYQVGSFGMHRAAANARARDAATGAALGLTLFFDRAANDYPVDVKVSDARGQLRPARLPRFHDGYTAAGGSLEAGVVDRGVVERALLRVYSMDYEKELQHNLIMTLPYGEARYGESTRGATLDLRLAGGPWRGRLLAGAAKIFTDFIDIADVVYDWYGEPVADRPNRGEISNKPVHQRIEEIGMFARLTVERTLGDHHAIRATVAPTSARRTGTDFLDTNPMGRDPASARRELRQVVTGVEYDTRAASDRLHNIAFAKHYAMWTDAEDVRPPFMFVPIERRARRYGVGDGLRYRLSPRLALKASYEWATRLPSVDETFGDSVLVQQNLELAPERSHNANLGARFEDEGRRGAITAETNLFARLADDFIQLLGNERTMSNQNIYAVRVLGIEGSADWVAPGEWASLEGAITVQDIRNVSSKGTYGAFDGDRIPNRPSLLGSLGGSVRTRALLRGDDELALFGNSRFVQTFFRGWESAGALAFKDVVASQLVHSAGVTYAVRNATPFVTTFEVQNLTDARVFDSYGVERPGRGFYLKLSTEL